ncbi:unnamed protein product [Arctia plantaginis]|uniref:Uncharacterized protein n=1 Tax=Arctia plantaginis TaxID=874455 RepID=A0A8S1B042_ARCPL|nr:unnamed protein product [Arctia plantaginis]CAB3252441.1 unnamed protein product [Arctia plantaginis]
MFWYKLELAAQKHGTSSFDQEKLVQFVQGYGSLEIAAGAGEYLTGMGDFTDATRVKHLLHSEEPNMHVHFGQATAETHGLYETLPAPSIDAMQWGKFHFFSQSCASCSHSSSHDETDETSDLPTNTEINESSNFTTNLDRSAKDAAKNKKTRVTKRTAEASPVININNTTDDMLLQEAMEVLHTKDDACYTFGKHVASELRKYDAHTLACVKKCIMDTIFEADMGRIPRQNNYGYFTQQYAGRQYVNESSSSSVYASTYVPTPSPQASTPSPQALTPSPQGPTLRTLAPTPSTLAPTSPQTSKQVQLEALHSVLNNKTDSDFTE